MSEFGSHMVKQDCCLTGAHDKPLSADLHMGVRQSALASSATFTLAQLANEPESEGENQSAYSITT